MKSPFKIAGFVLLIVVAIVIGWWLSSPRKSLPPVASTSKPAPAKPQTSAQQLLPKPDDLPKIVQPYARTPMLNLTDPRWKEYEAKRKLDPSAEWRTPIEFFGKVIDERNQPVAAAEVEIEWVGTREKYGGDGVGHRKMLSDNNGYFEIKGIEGKRLIVRVHKDGYYKRKSWNDGAFEYGGFWLKEFIEPDRNKPVIFHLVKRPVAESTYRIGSRIFLEPPALETHLDLLNENVQSTTPADLHVHITRPPGASYEKPFDWSVTIEGSNGAEIVETTDEFMLKAPAEGYQARLVRDYKNPTGNARQKARFYVRNKTRNFYAAVDFEMAAYRRFNGTEPASIIISAVVNPNNSQNLEYDPSKDIRKSAKQ